MMKNAIILLAFSLSFSAFAEEETIEKGYRISGTAVIKDFTLLKLTPTQDSLVRYITNINKKVPRVEAEEIASSVLTVSSCLKIDPWVLTGLIQKESSFQRTAVSPTNAAGLTQFTSLGLMEVNDQLGLRGKIGATENAILYFNSKIRDCIDPTWTDLWDRTPVGPNHEDFYSFLKEEIVEDILTAVTYGGILLKTYVAYVDTRNSKSEEVIPLSETYYQALQIYNGESGMAKVRYAKTIFKHVKAMYPQKVNFPFSLE